MIVDALAIPAGEFAERDGEQANGQTLAIFLQRDDVGAKAKIAQSFVDGCSGDIAGGLGNTRCEQCDAVQGA